MPSNFKIDHDANGVTGFRSIDSGHSHDGKDPHVHELTKDQLENLTLGDLDKFNDIRSQANVRDLTDRERREYSNR